MFPTTHLLALLPLGVTSTSLRYSSMLELRSTLGEGQGSQYSLWPVGMSGTYSILGENYSPEVECDNIV